MPLTTAENVMTDSVVSVSPESSLLTVIRLFAEEEIHAAPVVGDDGQLLGVISSSDVHRTLNEEQDTPARVPTYPSDLRSFSAPDWSGDLTDFQERLAEKTVEEIMSKGFISVERDSPLAEVARCLRENQIHRVWVVDGQQLCGVVSTLDLMTVIENGLDAG